MVAVPFSLYDAFSATAFGGSQAGVISDAGDIDQKLRQQIASEIGAPATAFISACSQDSVSVRFHSPVTEYTMCGHGTVCLMTRLIEQKRLHYDNSGCLAVDLCLPSSTSPVQIFRRDDGRPEVFLDIFPAKLNQHKEDQELLAGLLGIRIKDFDLDRPVESATGDFTHLIVPLRDLDAMARVNPDFPGLVDFCNQYGLQTIAVFCTQVENKGSDVHVRDFCPAVGVAESAGAGTTNAALTTYLIHHGFVQSDNASGQIMVQAEQGLELARPGFIRTRVSLDGTGISRLQVGGVATKIIDGELYLPDYS